MDFIIKQLEILKKNMILLYVNKAKCSYLVSFPLRFAS